eukprot:TRINITY_DN16086_c0_g1_i2.p1 TRINITY_DN16086_c0_g1~~TRINITY_DN16086_c0_g1_i2.p1  ORF type:complete len:158 (+),score=20.91 TRINITY_DN16086_c0_g1_i2:137-610(+)
MKSTKSPFFNSVFCINAEYGLSVNFIFLLITSMIQHRKKRPKHQDFNKISAEIYRKVWIRDLLKLEKINHEFRFGSPSFPFCYARIMGIVVLNPVPNRDFSEVVIDDSTGVITIEINNVLIQKTELKKGDLVDFIGELRYNEAGNRLHCGGERRSSS